MLQRVLPTTLVRRVQFRGWIRQETLCDRRSVTFDLRQCACWTTTVSAPPASIGVKVTKTAAPSTAHYRLKYAIDQALILRGSRDFNTTDDYAGFVRQMVERRNRLVEGKLEQEMLCLRSLPPAPVPEYVNYQSKVVTVHV